MAGIKTSVKIEGLDEIRRALRLLPENVQKNVLAKSTRAGAIVVRNDAKTRAPVLQTPDERRKSGTIRKAIRASNGKRNGNVGTAFVYIRVLTKKAISKFKKARAAAGLKIKGAVNPDDPFYWRFLEFGTSKMAARPFLRPAFESRKIEAADKIKDALREGVEKEAVKLAGKRFR